MHYAVSVKDSAIPYRHIALEYEAVANGHWATMRLTNFDNGNCIDAEMAEEIRDACRITGQDNACRLLVVTGSGSTFSVGRASVADLEGEVSGRLASMRVADCLAALPVPVLIVLNGDAIGHGLELALAGDLRIASESAGFALWEPGKPTMPWDGGTQRLPRLVGPAWALDMALTGRKVGPEEALRIGLVNRVVPADQLEASTTELVGQVLAAAPIAARLAKETVTKGMDLTLDQGLGLEADLSVILHSTSDRAEGIASFKGKRPPRYTGA